MSARASGLRSLLARHLAVLTLVQALVAALGTTFILAPVLRRQAEQAMASTALAMGQRLGQVVLQAGASVHGAAELLASSPSGTDAFDLLRVAALRSPELERVYLLDDRGVLRRLAERGVDESDARRLTGLDLSRSSLLRQAEAGRTGFGEPFLSPLSEQLMLGVIHSAGRHGWLVGEISMARLSKELAATVGSSGYTAMMVDPLGRVVAHRNPQRAGRSVQLSQATLKQIRQDGQLGQLQLDGTDWAALSSPVSAQDLGWRVLVMQPQEALLQPARHTMIGILLFTLFLLGVAFVASLLLGARVTRQIAKVATYAELLADERSTANVEPVDIAEIDVLLGSLDSLAGRLREREKALRELNAGLEAQVLERTEHLQQANTALNQTLTELRSTQKELIESEKLAALGALVASVAHEMNTPIGNAMVTASTLTERAQALRAQATQGPISRREFDKGLSDLAEAASLIERSTARAAELVSAFKQVAVDQTSAHWRRFHLATLCEEMALLFRERLRRKGATLTLELDRDLELGSFPGPLGQVLSNLIDNALLHGRDHDAQLHLSCREGAPGQALVELRDNGPGIPSDLQQRVFEPFFTTRRGRGGTGLGLTIVHNLVTGVLRGQIRIDTLPEGGTRAQLLIPTDLPGSGAAPIA